VVVALHKNAQILPIRKGLIHWAVANLIPPAKKFELVTKVGTAALSRPRYLQDAADA
jgi:hypothetical protein